jgi:hypothetical protein
MTGMNVPVKKLQGTVTLVLPPIEADPQAFQTYKVEEMAAIFKKLLQEDLIAQIEGPIDDDTIVIQAEVEVV